VPRIIFRFSPGLSIPTVYSALNNTRFAKDKAGVALEHVA
jgi:hypothetical protein